jgi:TonB-linked SusC/RagA family outer membrane protein
LRKSPLKLFGLAVAAVFLLMSAIPAMAQTGVRVKGVVTSEADGLPLIGVNVIQKGTTNGVVTDIDGNYELTAPQGAQLEFSYVGFLVQQLAVVPGKTVYNVILREDSQSLEEVVVVGYGVQKKKLITGATVQVNGDDIQKLSTTSVLTALQSQTPGVTIVQNNGQPGSGYIVNIRGLGTIGDASPLYVIDGVAGGDLNHISPSDIESIDVLKDAASSAIYGARAANGVVLVTTKQGRAGKIQLSYDGYYGQQYMYKKPDLLTAQEYMTIVDEQRFNDGTPGYDWANLLPKDLYQSFVDGTSKGSDWVDAFYNAGAVTQSHAINLTGGNEISKVSIGYSYTQQDGILGTPVASTYDRSTVRINSDHVLLKSQDMEVIKIGETLNYIYRTNSGISTGNIYWNGFHSVLVSSPLLPIYDENGDWYDYYDKADNGWTLDGNSGNPIAGVATSGQGLNLSKNHNLNMSAYLQIQPIRNLVFKSQFGYKMSGSTYRSYDMKIRLSNNTNRTIESISQSGSLGYSWTLDNTLAYKLALDSHTADIVVGNSLEQWGMGENISSGGSNNIFEGDWKYAWVDNTKPTELSQRSAGGSPWGAGRLASFFGRINYNYAEKYMLSATLRADGSSNFAPGKRWGYFPSVSAGWVATNEGFLEGAAGLLDFLKLRASWGQNGNSNISAFQYLSTFAFSTSNVYYFGTDKKTPSTGAYADILKNPNVSWETAEQIDLGVDARFLNSRLGVVFDWYKRTTKDWLVDAPILAVYGLNAPYINGGDVVNKGVELALNWQDNAGRFTYGGGLNFTHNENEVTRLDNSEGIIHGDANVLSQGTTEMYRVQVGYPIGYFYGYKTAGVFQNWDEVNATAVKVPGAQPGDLIFVDSDGSGVIDEYDRTMIGNPHPKYQVGINFNLGYQGFDLNVSASGALGLEIAKSYRSFADSPLQNYTTDIFGRWTGEGTSNKLPRLNAGSHTNWQYISDIYIEDGDYLKIQNVTLGYDFKKLLPKLPLGQARLYFTAQNLYTFTGYSGMDPEIGFGNDKSWVTGVDLGYYPASRSYLVGVNLKF